MIKLKQILTPLGLGLTVWGILTLPAKAQRIIIINQPSSGYPYPVYPSYPYRYTYETPRANYIYGSPIPTPIPVNPYTGHSAINNNGNNRVIYYQNPAYPTGYYYPNTGSSFYYNSNGQLYLNIGN